MIVGSPLPRAPAARLAGFGAARPDRIVDAATLTAPFGKSAQWLRTRTGIESVRRLGPDDSLVDLAVTAAQRGLADADVTGAEVDIVLVATCSVPADPARPSMARRVAARVAPRALTFDVNAACAGFCYSLSTAAALVATGAARAVLVVGAEQMSRLVDPADLGTSILFGDGAGAAVVVATEPGPDGRGSAGTIATPAWSSDGARAGVLEIPPGTTRLRMQGSAVFRWAVAEVHKVATEALTRAGVRPDQIEVFVPHQANLRIIEAVAERVGVQGALVADDVVRTGNTSAASIPLAVSALRETGVDLHGRLALLTGFGAGLAVAAQVVVLP